MTHPCYLCGSNETNTSLCAGCAEDLTALGMKELPSPDATKEEVVAWARSNKVSVFVCQKSDFGPMGEDW